MSESKEKLCRGDLDYIFNHVFLPPSAPQGVEEDEKTGAMLLGLIYDVAQAYQRESTGRTSSQWGPINGMLRYLCDFHSGKSLSVEGFSNAIASMKTGGQSPLSFGEQLLIWIDVLALHIDAQNAGLILRRSRDEVVFESFEVLPKAGDVMSTKGRLLCSYPGPAIAVSFQKVASPEFLAQFSSFIQKMKSDVLEGAILKNTILDSEVFEERDSAHPRFITEMLTGILRAIGRPAEIQRIQKRIADDVVWYKALQWRRSPLWLVVKIALQTTLKSSRGPHYRTHTQYKAFMVFLIAEILELAFEYQLPSDTLFVMNAKLSRRAYKMGAEIPQFVLNKAHEIGGKVNELLNSRWMKEQEHHRKPLAPSWKHEEPQILQDTILSLSSSSGCLKKARDRSFGKKEQAHFESRGGGRIQYHSSELPQRNIGEALGREVFTVLADFELWVQKNIEIWVAASLKRGGADGLRDKNIHELLEWMEDYTTAGQLAYASNPENMSILILTTMELWVALDKLTVTKYDLLVDYFPEFPENILAPLLLPKFEQIVQLNRVERYLRERRERADLFNPSIFSSILSSGTFAIRYFKDSLPHQELRRRIENEAKIERALKVAEYEEKNKEYKRLRKSASTLSCHYTYDAERGWRYHDWPCKKCELNDSANSLRISVHEYPLPEDELERMAVVFELQCPLEFLLWRDMTYRVLVDILTPPGDGSGDSYETNLEEYPGLEKYFNSGCSTSQRLHWSSKNNYFHQSYYSDVRFPSSVDAVFVDNALDFGLFDTRGSAWAENHISGGNAQQACTFKLPNGPYTQLQYTVDSTLHTPNEIISNQSKCPAGLQLHEFISFGLLRAGHRIQWLNIVRELRLRTLDLSHEAVYILLIQSAWQAGPPDLENWEICRDSHRDLREPGFGHSLLHELENILRSIDINWKETVLAQVLVGLSVRLLSLSKDESIKERVVGLLRKAREVTFGWIQKLADQLKDCNENRVKLLFWTLQAALACRATYNVDPIYLKDLLRSEDVETFVECAMIVYDNTPSQVDDLPHLVRVLLDRDRRLSHAVEERLRRLITSFAGGLDLKNICGVQRTSWRSSKSNSSWVKMETDEAQKVKYNLLSGGLLVDGIPPGKMPSKFVSHATYMELFGDKVLRIRQSTMLGMSFVAKHNTSDQKLLVHFAMEGEELIIRTENTIESSLYELIPRKMLKGDFPAHIIEGYLYWLEVSTGDIQLRGKEDPWPHKKIFPCSWYIPHSKRVLYLDLGEQIIDVRSPTALMINLTLRTLEHPNHIDIRIVPEEKRLSAYLPRLNLEFFKNSRNEFECRQLSGMVIDENQDIGALIGLESRLVLRKGSIRSVIIPYGAINFLSHDNHVRVHINTRDLARVKYYVYTIDTKLGRLVGDGSLASQLYRIYLHAVTANPLPDPLTHHTGTEEALNGLRSAATWSFQKLEVSGIEAGLLKAIASLTPGRVYYPKNLQVMQQVDRKRISPLVQHDEFHAVVSDIFAHASRFHVFEIDSKDKEDKTYYKTNNDNHLMKRAAIHNAWYRTMGFGGSLMNSWDSVYSSRDAIQDSEEEARVWGVARAVEHQSPCTGDPPQLMDTFKEWAEIEGWEEIKVLHNIDIKLGYDERWLEPNLADTWCSLYNSCRRSSVITDKYGLMFLFSTIAYGKKVDLALIEALLAFAAIEEFSMPALDLPRHQLYNLADGFRPEKPHLIMVTKRNARGFEESNEAQLSTRSSEDETELQNRRFTAYQKNLISQSHSFVDNLLRQWPCAVPRSVASDVINCPLLDIQSTMEEVAPLFRSWYRNKGFDEHIRIVQDTLENTQFFSEATARKEIQRYSFSPSKKVPSLVPCLIKLETLLNRDIPTLPSPPIIIGPEVISKNSTEALPAVDDRLEFLISDFESQNPSEFEQRYARDLWESFRALQYQNRSIGDPPIMITLERMALFRGQCAQYLEDIFKRILESLLPKGKAEDLMYMAQLWPRISPTSLLRRLATNESAELTTTWKYILVTYGEAFTMFQRSERLLALALESGTQLSPDFVKEVENVGHQHWSPMQQPDWLLIEIENNFLVRPVQTQIASRMTSPPSNTNTVMQLCMGEGKSSVIVPLVASALADGKKLVRVIVLKPLCSQMFQLLVQRLGGLTNRRIFYMPFSRSLDLDIEKANMIQTLYKECMEDGAIMLVQPEHILSFKLMGLQRLYQGGLSGSHEDREEETHVAKTLLNSYRWLKEHSRDILDESDEALHVRNELIYTIGGSKHIEGHPERWTITQEIFSLIQKHLVDSVNELEAENRPDHPGSFPYTRIVNMTAKEDLIHKIASMVIEGYIQSISFRFFPKFQRKLAEKFITDPDMTEDEIRPLATHFKSEMGSLLLLRGLIAHNLLLFSLKDKRWRVDYGLDLNRTMMAVPYRAKDLPATNAEFSHPDVAIILTCLSYYYGGLSNTQLRACFQNMYKLDNPTVEYERWLQEFCPPKELMQLNSINLDDTNQWDRIILPTFRYNKSVIDFYLAEVVFPMEAKEFSQKLSSSGWDIAELKTHPTTGFSGTNDNRYLLPLSINQYNSPDQLSTNAKVLSYLLQEENEYVEGKNGECLRDKGLIEFLVREDRPVRVLLDVGAQMLKLSNREVAEYWLGLVPESETEAVILFNKDDELIVRTRDGTTERLQVSRFANQLEKCLVYLDEAHTRGTDLGFPMNSRAAVTLGPFLTKDRLVQACMRMRRLGNGHSVMFCAPPEIHKQIRELSIKASRDSINVSDVLHWCMTQTCINTSKTLPTWAKQGISYQTRYIAWNGITELKVLPSSLLEKEAKTLEDRYGFQPSGKDIFNSLLLSLSSRHSEICLIQDKCREFSVISFDGDNMMEEQEREQEFEFECEWEIQRPGKVKALDHHLYPAVQEFITTGTLPLSSTDYFIPAFSSLSSTSVAGYNEIHKWSTSILATRDFLETVKLLSGDKMDDFLRPVNWVVSSNTDHSILVIMSPFEIDRLMPKIRQSQSVTLHMYSPKVTKAAASYECLRFCTIPPLFTTLRFDQLLVDQLNIFAGQLYLRDSETYERLCGFLSLYLGQPSTDYDVIQGDGFVQPTDRQRLHMKLDAPFSTSQVPFLKGFIGFRRKGQSYLPTHMGQILYGRLLKREDFRST